VPRYARGIRLSTEKEETAEERPTLAAGSEIGEQ
jgi:hypothetical protein